MPPIELYIAEDKSIYRINRLTENPAFFTYQALSQEEINKLVQNNKRNQKNACLEGDNHKAPGTGARTDTRDGNYGGDYLQK